MVDVSGVLERMNGCVVVPTFNESKIIYDLIREISKYHLKVIVIDDGSRDNTKSCAERAGAEVIVHNRNKGKGASLRTGFKRSIEENFDFTIVMDGDGQHHPDDIKHFLDRYREGGCDLLIGNRMDDTQAMPYPRWLTNKIMSMLISSICKQYIPDTQCGFRLIRNSVLKDITIATSNYEIESEMLIETAKKGYRISSIPIRTIYEGQDSQINPVVDTVRFFKFLLKDWSRGGWTILKEFFNDIVIKHGSIIFLSSIVCNVFSLLFWLIMIRALSQVEYGILNAMVSFLAVLGLPSLVFQTVLARYFAEFKAQENKENMQALFRAFFKRMVMLNGVFSVIVFALAPRIVAFLRLNATAFVYMSIVAILSSSFLVLTLSSMQGLGLFPRIAVNSIFLGFSKLISGVLLVFAGLQSLGGFLGFVLANFFAFILSLFQLPPWIFQMSKKAYTHYKPHINLKEIYGYFFPVSIALFAYTLFTNTDIILVKHFFNESDAGVYSIAQTVGKILLYLSSSVTLVFFPVTVQHSIQKRNTLPLLKKSLVFVGVLSALAVCFTFAFPRFMLKVVSGKALPACIPLVRLIIFPMSIFSIVYLFIFYNLSLGNKRFIYLIFCLSVLQIFLISVFHETLFDVIAMLFLSSVLSLYVGVLSIRGRHTNEKN